MASTTINLPPYDFTDTDWQNLGDVYTWDMVYVPEPSTPTDPTPLAVLVLNAYSIPIDTASLAVMPNGAGTLAGYDIHNMDALNVIKFSVFERIRDQLFIELYTNAAGEAEFVEIGANTFGGTPRYNIPNRKVVNRAKQIQTTGFNPPAMVYVRGPFDILRDENNNTEMVNDIANVGLKDTCYEELFERYATIMYRTPILRSDWGDILDSLYEVDAFEQIIGWIHKILIDDALIAASAEVVFSDITPYPYQMPQFEEDEDYIRYGITPGTEQDVRCFIPPDIDFNEVGHVVQINNSTYIDETTGQELTDIFEVNRVFLMGWEVVYTYTQTGVPGTAGTTFTASCKHRKLPIVLSEGSDYAWGFDNQNNLKIVFGIGETPADVYLEEERNVDITTPDYIIGGPYWGEDTAFAGTGVIHRAPGGFNLDGYRMFPHIGGSHTGGAGDGFGTTYVFEALWVVVNRRKSSITIYDPHGQADAALRNSSYELYAMIQCDPPAPVSGRSDDPEGFDGPVDQTDCIFDHDPMTVQDLTTCDSELLQNAMDGSSLSMTMPFIQDVTIDITNEVSTVTYPQSPGESELYQIADFIYDLTNEEITEVTYIFGPDDEPKLGDNFSHNGIDGIINSVTYSYQDSSSYLITVVVGPKYLKDTVSANDASIWQQQVETVTKEGVVTQVAGNGIHYAVHVEGMGDFIAVNTVVGGFPPEVGDRVTVEINNVPVGWR
jgi:hypothetical protein